MNVYTISYQCRCISVCSGVLYTKKKSRIHCMIYNDRLSSIITYRLKSDSSLLLTPLEKVLVLSPAATLGVAVLAAVAAVFLLRFGLKLCDKTYHIH